MSEATIAPPPLWDAVLQQAPMHVFLFDAGLICRYAAPVEGRFLGRPPSALLGRPADRVLPEAAQEVRHALERAAAGEPWQHSAYRLTCDGKECRWQIVVRPLSDGASRGICLCIAERKAESEAELEQLRSELAGLRRVEEQRRRELRELHAALRAGIAPISGYLQLMTRRPQLLRHLPVAETIAGRVLPALDRLTRTVDRLGEAARPAGRPPAQPCRR